jgi:D-alanyl-lipoteichoic acid acyltransferase DltB (MBOAT superfamily)
VGSLLFTLDHEHPVNFVQTEFLWFMLIVFTVYWAAGTLRHGRVLQNVLLVGASMTFYGWVRPEFLLLLYFSATLDYFLGRLMEKHPLYKSYLLMTSIAGNIGVLCYFKYFNFFIDNIASAISLMGLDPNLRTLSIILPVGVSFYTFQTLSYTIDIYRGELKARTNYLDYIVFVSFFPQLVAGPIERAGRLLPQVEKARVFDIDKVLSGLSLAMWGAFKKICLADTVAPYVDKVFILEDPSGPLIWAASIGFMMQIFADFSGYTDIARGTARMLGFELVENFKSPYLAASTPEFWQRWHISLSFWIRDYIMVPLLGTSSRLTLLRFIWATIATFTIIGFWHGASWNFILFGAFHGVWMTIYTLVNRHMPQRVRTVPFGRPMAVTFHLLAVSIPGSMLFRETHVQRIWQHLTKNPFVASDAEWMATSVVLGMVAVVSFPLCVAHVVERWVLPKIEGSRWMLPLQTTTWSLYAVGMFVFYRVSTYDFIYFQF